MNYLSVCSGIEAATCAWQPLGWDAVAFSEIEAFPSAVLAHHYPETPNLGDMTRFEEWPDARVDVLIGGTPCQSFSVAGLRKGIADPRGNLMLTYLAIAERYRPEWLVWENVPGVLSSNGGRDFGTFLGALGELGYGFAYRVLDAQYFGLAQRRKRVFVVGSARGWAGAASVLFEPSCLRGDSAPGREAGRGSSSSTAGRAGGRSWPAEIAPTINAAFSDKQGLEDQHALSGAGLFVPDISPALNAGSGIKAPDTNAYVAATLRTRRPGETGLADEHTQVVAHAFDARQSDVVQYGNMTGPLDTQASTIGVMQKSAVRRLTPVECERLQGFPDGYTEVPYRGKAATDGPRYKALGNSMAVPVIRWIGERIESVDDLLPD